MAGLFLLQLEPRSVRRIRLLFSSPLAVGAFTTPSLYTVTCTDGSGASPTVVAALAVPDSPAAAELALSNDLAPGGAYTVSAVAVPALNATTTAPGTELPLRQPERPAGPSQAISAEDVLAFAYGKDIVFQSDFLETADGDLAKQSGAENVRSALVHAMVSDGLSHDSTYGAHPREYVDGPAAALGTLPGKVQRALLRDDRVKRVRSVKLEDFNSADPGKAIITADVELIGGVTVTSQTAIKAS